MSTTLFTLVRQLGFEAGHGEPYLETQHSGSRGRQISEFQGRLVYSVISRSAEAV